LPSVISFVTAVQTVQAVQSPGSSRLRLRLRFDAAGDFWHSDQSYRQEPSLATFLYAHKLPMHGGDTEFADMHGAYESLPDDIKKRHRGAHGVSTSAASWAIRASR